MLTITLNLPLEAEQQLEKDLKKLENLTEKPKEFHIKKALTRYLKHADKMVKYYEKEKIEGNLNAEKELLEHLNLKEIDWEK